MNKEKIFKSITDWIDEKHNQFSELEIIEEEKFYLTVTFWYDGWYVELNEDLLMNSDDLEWDDEIDDYTDVLITLEKKFKEHLNWYKQIANKFK